ncbi:DUF2285 domain-containing protein [Sphingomonas gilva]|uniref:DUF2285 domain-containing protein n=1 Tax=Sphingomonas gilva TaxID=2305907 RepID=A0A396RQG7_9SPHN|nr:DUF2285 domain-containing protein [Sphingomonas gilva]RHW18196.1 DUF2285 domain-containing protein [Sphingomonas gilva]
MSVADCPAADWRDAALYAALIGCDRAGFAWEWLRRDPAYRRAWAAGNAVAARRFGLCRLEPPARDMITARPLWCAEIDSHALRADAVPDAAGDPFNVAALADLAVVHIDDESEHWLFSDGYRHLRLDITSGTLRDGPVGLCWRLSGLRNLPVQLVSLRRLVALAKTGRFAASLHPPERRAARWVAMLRVHDALTAGATHREIAGVLFGSDSAGPRWRVHAPDARLRVQRLAVQVRGMAATGPGGWLCTA